MDSFLTQITPYKELLADGLWETLIQRYESGDLSEEEQRAILEECQTTSASVEEFNTEKDHLLEEMAPDITSWIKEEKRETIEAIEKDDRAEEEPEAEALIHTITQ